MFLKNTWYVACQAEEITDKPLGRKVCNEAMVFFKNAEGKVSAVQDFCPHRGTPLSLGRVCNGQLVCGYHGLVMGCDGHTVSMPGHQVRGFEPVKHYPTLERYGFVWVWPGDPKLADPGKMPEFEWFENPKWAYGGGLYHIRCDYRLMIDNLMDLTHETYVHSTSIGQPEIDETPSRTVTEGDRVITSRFMEGIKAPPFWKMAMRAHDLPDDATVDRWQICKFTPPSHVLIEVGVALAGKGGYAADPQHKAYSVVVDFITPETDSTIHYFWGMVRQFKPEDTALTAQIRDGQGKIFSEDLEMLERQQRNLDENPERKLKVLSIDAGGVMSRRVIDRLLAAENSM